MQITPLSAQETFPPKYTAIPGSNTDFLFSTAKYEVVVKYGSSAHYAPDFYYVHAKNKQAELLWSGGERLFLESFFQSEFISDAFDRMILCEIHDTGNSSSLQILLVDLKTGQEQHLTDIGSHNNYGHFQSFDAVFYWNDKDIWVEYLNTNEKFALYSVLKEHLPDLKAWRPCPVPNCVVVATASEQNNVSLFNFREKRIVEQATLTLEKADNINIFLEHAFSQNMVVLKADYGKRDEYGILRPLKTERYKIEF